jgi:hypothetical protein
MYFPGVRYSDFHFAVAIGMTLSLLANIGIIGGMTRYCGALTGGGEGWGHEERLGGGARAARLTLDKGVTEEEEEVAPREGEMTLLIRDVEKIICTHRCKARS